MPDGLVLPPPPADPAGLAPGTVIVQWAVQDGCWQLPQSWQAGGSLSQGQVRDGVGGKTGEDTQDGFSIG